MVGTRPRGQSDTTAQILDSAERLVQVRGFNSFSYADIASELKISKASLHYHFPGKAVLGEALIARYAARFAAALQAIDRDSGDATDKLEAYVRMYADVLSDRRMCLCGMLAADFETLPPPMQAAVIGFFDQNEAWLTEVLESGREQGTLRLAGSAREAAQAIISGLEGALLIARPYGDLARFHAAAARLLTSLAGTAEEVDGSAVRSAS